jgi:tRNA pseudouridine55 synthase
LENIQKAIQRLTGHIAQLPPQHSAIKIEGMRSYHRLRENIPLDLPVRWVHIYEFELVDYQWPLIQFRIKCSRGTYIRAIARDLGDLLGCGGYLTKLERTSIGPYHIAESDHSLIGLSTGKSRMLKEKVMAAHPELIF